MNLVQDPPRKRSNASGRRHLCNTQDRVQEPPVEIGENPGECSSRRQSEDYDPWPLRKNRQILIQTGQTSTEPKRKMCAISRFPHATWTKIVE